MELGRVARLEAVGHMRGLRRKNTWDRKKKNVESTERKELAMKIIRRAAEVIMCKRNGDARMESAECTLRKGGRAARYAVKR